MKRWNGEVLAWALIGLGAGILVGGFVGGLLGTVALWIGLTIPVILAVRLGIPRGILVFRPIDLLYAIVLGTILRFAQGGIAVAFGGSGALPSYPSLDGTLPPVLVLSDVIAGALIAPTIEEFFFRGVLLVAIFTLVRRAAGRAGAAVGIGGAVAVLASALLFVGAHLLVSGVGPDDAVSLLLLGLVTGALVAFTGRIWPAVLVHVVYNGLGVVLTIAGTLLG